MQPPPGLPGWHPEGTDEMRATGVSSASVSPVCLAFESNLADGIVSSGGEEHKEVITKNSVEKTWMCVLKHNQNTLGQPK